MLRQFFREAVAVQGRRDPVADRSASWVGPAGPQQVVADGETVLERDHAGAVDLAQHRDEHLGGRDHDLVARLQGRSPCRPSPSHSAAASSSMRSPARTT